jgi:predicted transcriptional regulator
MVLQRMHIMLDPEQKRVLEEIAQQQKRSVSELAREYISDGIERFNQERAEDIQRRLAALDRAEQVRMTIRRERGGMPLDVDVVEIIREMRAERHDEL